MKILFQGGYHERRDPPANEPLVRAYVEALARRLVDSGQQIVTTYLRDYDKLLTDLLVEALQNDGPRIKKHLTYFLPDSVKDHPPYGIVKRYKAPPYWTSERTLAVSFCEAVIIIGGGRGTADTLEKALLSRKPVFVAYQIKGYPAEVWDRHAGNYFYLTPGDADFITDENTSPEEFFDHVFAILAALEAAPANPQMPQANTEALPFEQLRKLVAQGYIDKALARALETAATIDRGLANQLSVLSGSYHLYRRDKSLGIQEQSEQLNRIMLAFLDILTELEGMRM